LRSTNANRVWAVINIEFKGIFPRRLDSVLFETPYPPGMLKVNGLCSFPRLLPEAGAAAPFENKAGRMRRTLSKPYLIMTPAGQKGLESMAVPCRLILVP
jgi:hypothetical protein